ncbi:MAG: UDP-N-acetylmuramoyl-L-alanyl-D-glutamate--2,6-diaminopimelate ligase [Synergistaceae bacterium]|nr:UDP-N-acetylmuramoyl-L-alanyl-D-glutamate--2,6-diaminopimelate ligase [Synergistaceae bacterium]
MTIKVLLQKLQDLGLNFTTKHCDARILEDVNVLDVYSNSRETHCKESIFVATKGLTFDGHVFALDLARQGRVNALLLETAIDYDIPQIIVSDSRRAMGILASVIYGIPSNSLQMIGITGTNGKTTTSFIVRSILNKLNIKTGMCGTIIYDDGKKICHANHTTPEGCDLQRLFKDMVVNLCKACVMEVSSHSLAQGRVDGTKYDVAVFTNLTEDHLDFHKTMENYFEAKKLLFTKYLKTKGTSCIVVDSSWGSSLANIFSGSCITISLQDEAADIFAKVLEENTKGTKLALKVFKSSYIASIPFVGRHNIYNALCAIAAIYGLGIDMERILSVLSEVEQVPGRLEKYVLSNGVVVVIDFAHTPDGLEKVLAAMNHFSHNNLICVFGAGGDRDKTKRPIMGSVAGSLCDKVIITSDNPRSEEPTTIIKEIEEGLKNSNTYYEKICDRREGVYRALDIAKEGDIVVIAGRGHETHQILADKVIPLQDKNILTDWAREKCVKII